MLRVVVVVVVVDVDVDLVFVATDRPTATVEKAEAVAAKKQAINATRSEDRERIIFKSFVCQSIVGQARVLLL
jgi:hypothetical protein